jgi:hypothetical protein
VKKERELGRRKCHRIDFDRSAFIILEPDAPWIECSIVDISETGVRLRVGALVVPEIFGLALNSAGSVRRVCSTTWRSGETMGARFLSADELRNMALELHPARSDI